MVLVTGATGLVGSHLILYLLENNESVRAIYRDSNAIEKTRSIFQFYDKASLFNHIAWIEADITETPSLDKAFQNIDFVYHCAGCISFDPNDEKLLRKTNIEGTANIVNFCLRYSIKKLCHVSSIAALGDLKPGEFTITEATEWNPEMAHSDYAISKHGAEMEVWRGQQEGLNVVIVNPGIIIGAGFWQTGSGQLFTNIANGFPFFTKGTTGFVAVNDVSRAMVSLMTSDRTGDRFILVAEVMSFEKLLKIIANALQVKTPSLYAKPWMTNMYWRIDWLLSALGRKRKYSKLMARASHQMHDYSSEKIRSEIDFEFDDIENILTQTAKAFSKSDLY